MEICACHGRRTIAAIAMIAYAFFRPALNPEEEERRRRLHLNQIGRIAEGQSSSSSSGRPNQERCAGIGLARAPNR